MNAKSEKQLNDLVDDLKAKLEDAEKRANEAEEAAEKLSRKFENDNLGWSHPRKMEYSDLPLPRLEMRWSREDQEGYTCICTYMLVYEYFLGREKIAGKDDPEVVGLPLGQTRSSGSPRPSFIEKSVDDPKPIIRTPFREWSHALSDSEHMKFPLYVSTEDGDLSIVEKVPGQKFSTQRMLKVGGKDL